MTRGSPPSTQILKFNPVSNQVVKNINMQTQYFLQLQISMITFMLLEDMMGITIFPL